MRRLAFSVALGIAFPLSAGTFGGATSSKSKPTSPAVAAPHAPAAAAGPKSSAGVFRPDSSPYGTSYSEWTARFWQWYTSIPLNVGPALDTTGIHCAINQHGPVWYVGGPLGSTFTRSCTIPEGTALLAPVVNYLNDYPCPAPPPFEPAPGQTLEDFLLDGARAINDLVTVREVQLDGVPLEVDRVETGLFPFTAAADLSAFDPCLTGSPQLGVSDGYFSFLKPLSPGVHVLHMHSEIPALGLSTDGTLKLTVVKAKP